MPRLEQYHAAHKHYPDTLAELGPLPAVPSGLVYSRQPDTLPPYQFVYRNTCYYPNVDGSWWDDD